MIDVRFDRSEIHRLRLSFWNQQGLSRVVDEPGPMIAVLSLSWGGHGDPVWVIDWTLPHWAAERLPVRG